MRKGVESEPLTFNRKVLIASASVTRRKNTIHCLARADVTEPRRMIRAHYEKTGEKLSFTAYIVTCLAQVLRDHPRLNAFIRRNRLVILEDVTISVLVEREFRDEKIPEPVGIARAQMKTFRQISQEIREAKSSGTNRLGGLTGSSWIRFIPSFLLRSFVRVAERNIALARKYGKVAVTAVGMFTSDPVWFTPHGSGTVLLTVGSIEKRSERAGEAWETREYLCLTGSFDHDIVDGAPAARFMSQLLGALKSGDFLQLQEGMDGSM